jgi:glucosamine--fructose-6-phosphate aminotransferase (isomerizing)
VLDTPTSFSPDIAAALEEGLSPRELRRTITSQVDVILQDPRIASARRLVLTGSGDSLFAAVAALPAVKRWSRLDAVALSALDFARYEVPLLRSGDVAVTISNSGNSTRTQEAAILARASGIPTIGVTGSRDGPLASLVDHILHRPVARGERVAPQYARVMLNMTEYIASMMALLSFGAALGCRRGGVSGQWRDTILDRISAAIAAIPSAAYALEPSVARVTPGFEGADTVFCLGAGPSRGTADYAAAKFHEQGPINGVSQDLEEWAHLQYFLTLAWKDRAVVIVHAPQGNASDRAEEIVNGIADAGGRAFVVATPGHGKFDRAAYRLDVLPVVDELLTPILFHLPAQLLVLHLAQRAGVSSLPVSRQDAYRLIRHGLMRNSTNGLI